MASLELTEERIAALKAALRKKLPLVKSSHLSEAIAAALGQRTNAALRAVIQQHADDPPFVFVEENLFSARLEELGYPWEPYDFEAMDLPLIPTRPTSAKHIRYETARERAWRNVIVAAINAGLEQKVFSLRPNDNRWPRSTMETSGGRPAGRLYDFTIANLPARAYVRDFGHGELVVHAAVNPRGNAALKRAFAGFAAGDVYARTWLERLKGAWVQSSPTQLACRRHLLPLLAELEIETLGYGESGHVCLDDNEYQVCAAVSRSILRVR